MPGGLIASNSGWTLVFVDGTSTPNFLRQPSESVMSVSFSEGGAARSRAAAIASARRGLETDDFPDRRVPALHALGAAPLGPARQDRLQKGLLPQREIAFRDRHQGHLGGRAFGAGGSPRVAGDAEVVLA